MPDPGGGQDIQPIQQEQTEIAGHFLADRGVAVFPQTQTAPRYQNNNTKSLLDHQAKPWNQVASSTEKWGKC